MKSLLAKKSTQVLENLTGIAMANGFVLPKDMDRKKWAEQKLELSIVQHDDVTSFLQSLIEVEKIRDYFVTQLKQTLQPIKYGIDRQWRQTQQETLEGIIRAFEQWYTRPLVEVPTGVGKSMIWGAIIRAFYDTLRMFGVEDKFEVVLFTSRIYIADQMIGSSGSEENDDEPLIYGDVKIWLPHLTDDDIRILAGRSGSSKEAKKNAKLTISCYQGLSPKILDLTYIKKAGLVILDESHRATNRVRIILDNKMHTAFFVGGSATTKGPIGNNPFKFFEAMKEEMENGNVVPYSERLAYHASILDCIERKEFKPVRYINVRTSIDLSSLPSSTKTLPERKAGKLIAKSLPLMKQLLEELFLGEYPALTMVGTKAVIDRKWLVFVERIKIAEKLADYCNTELKPLLLKKYGKKVHFVADYVSGEMGHNQFNGRMIKYHNNATTIMFSSDKLGEGADVPDINGIFSLRAYSAKALWKAIQEMGRGGRHVKGEDLLMVDGILKSKKHEIASALTVFGINTFVNGGLVAGYTGEREAETKVFTLLKSGLNWKQVWNKLTKEEKVLVPFIREYLGEKGEVDPQTANYNKQIRIKSIEFVENEAVRFKRKGHYLTWQEASKAVLSSVMKVTSVGEYGKLYKSIDDRLPYRPEDFYRDFPGWPVFLNYKTPPEGWIIPRQLKMDTGKAWGTVLTFINPYRKTNPEWFHEFWFDYRNRNGKNAQGLTEFISFKLAKKFRTFYNNKSFPLKGWRSASSLGLKEFKGSVSPNTIKSIAETYRKINPEWFQKRNSFSKPNLLVECYSPQLIKRIRQAIKKRKERLPNWKSANEISKKYGSVHQSIKMWAEKYRKGHKTWFENAYHKGKGVELYHPKLVKLLIGIIKINGLLKKGWVNPTSIATNLGVSLNQNLILREANKYKKTNPEWFETNIWGEGTREFYHPKLATILKDIFRKMTKPAPRNWIARGELMMEFSSKKSRRVKIFIDKKRKSSPNDFSKFKKNRVITEFISLKVAKIVRHNFGLK